MSESWTVLPALDGRSNPCLCCPPIQRSLPMDAVIAVGFGDAHVECDGRTVYREPSAMHGPKPCTECAGLGRIGMADLRSPRVLKRQSKKNKIEWAEYHRATAALPVCGVCGGLGDVDDPDAPPAEYWEVADAERAAAADPHHDWRIVLFGPLHGEEYQRHGDGQWNLIVKNEGFA